MGTGLKLVAMVLTAAMATMAWGQDTPKTEPAKQPEKQPEKPAEKQPEKPAVKPAETEKPKDEQKERYMYVMFKTTMGEIVIELDNEKAPISAKNFVDYTESGHFDGTIFHRVIPKFMIQGGGFDTNMKQKETRPPIKNEWKNGLKNLRGTLSMARTSNPESATSQFFINVVDNPFLDQDRGDGAAYAVFGKVVKGMDVCDRIVASKTVVRNGMRDVPETPILVEKATKLTPEEGAKAKGGS